MSFKELDKKLQYYKTEAENGHYHNPNIIYEEMTKILDGLYPLDENFRQSIDSTYLEYEDRIEEASDEFWSW